MFLYTVTFNANGQEFTEETAPASQLCWNTLSGSNRKVTRPADPAAKDSDYRFVGWTVGPEKDSGAFDFATSISSKTVIYAQWERITDDNTFPVTAERATITGSSNATRGEDYHATLVPVNGYELPFRETSSEYTTRTHIKIDGQMLNTANYTLNLETGELTIPGEYITGRVDIVTVPRQNPFIIRFDANGGTGTQEGDGAKVYDSYGGYEYAHGYRPMGYYSLPSCTFTPPEKKQFSHWNFGPNSSDVYKPGDTFYVYNDRTFYAVWKDKPEETYTVSYNLTGCNFSGSTNASNGSDYTTVITPKDGYAAPITLSSVQVGGKTLDSSEYLTTQDSKTGALTITVPGDKITGNMIITASAERVYTVSFNTDGGTIIPSKTTVKWTDKVLDGVSDPTKEGWKFTAWKYGDVPVTPQTTYKELAVEDTVLSIELEAQWEDIAAPTGEIRVGEKSWDSFANMITFGLFFKDTQTVTITASDNSGEAVTISYLLSDKALAEDKLAAKEFNTYTDGFDIEPNNEWIIYAKLTDKAGNVRYLSSDGIVLDNVAPVISGIENGKTYCEAQTVTVDEKYIDSVTVNGTKVSLDENSRFTLSAAVGTQTIVATDKAGNETSVTVTVNNGHRGGEATCTSKAICDYCGEEYGEIDSTNHNLEKVPAKGATVTESGNIEYWQCQGCGKYFAGENGENEIQLDDTVISKLPPEIIEGKGQRVTAGKKKELSFKSNAAFSDFIGVELDGKTLDAKNYTVKEGSTVVTLKADYVARLSVGKHTIGIVSESGTAETTFTVKAKAAVNDGTNPDTGATTSPQTGDNSNLTVWFALLAVSAAGVMGAGVYSKRRRSSR